MTFNDVMAELRASRNEAVFKYNTKRGAGENQFGVTTTNLRALAKRIKANPELAKELWDSGNIDAMLLATLLMKPKQLSVQELDSLVESVTFDHVADWLVTNVIKAHPDREGQRERWMNSDHEWTSRIGWSLTTARVGKNPEGLDIPAILDRIESEMGSAPESKQWPMDFCLIEIGVQFPELRERAIAIGEKLGVFRNYPVSKGCVSPFAPIAIPEMVKRKEGR
ncbi:MAG: DNA alkylation repair protein [Fimbriimonadaceae bacterium]|nr:DNA alkylation repair protein [Fimbriimonadaceae bacterium]